MNDHDHDGPFDSEADRDAWVSANEPDLPCKQCQGSGTWNLYPCGDCEGTGTERGVVTDPDNPQGGEP